MAVSDVILTCTDEELEGLCLTNPNGEIVRRQNDNVLFDNANKIVDSTSTNVAENLKHIAQNMKNICTKLAINNVYGNLLTGDGSKA